MLKKFSLPIILLASVSACSTMPVQTNINNSRDYALTSDQVWTRLVEYLSTNNIQVKTIEKDSGIVYAEPSNSNEAYSDCGTEALAIVRSHPASLNIFVREASNRTSVTVNTNFKETRQYDTSTWTVDCFSTGILEASILDYIGG